MIGSDVISRTNRLLKIEILDTNLDVLIRVYA